MNKLQFLAELKSNIHMLEDEEQTDILDEYSQHVDMKVASGMTEKEAIAEFGPIDELIEEILAAYHVKVPEKKAKPLSAGAHGIVEGGKSAAEAAAGATKKGYSKIKGATLGAFEKIHGKEKTARKPLFSAAANGVARGTSNLWSRCVTATKTCIRWCWNVFVACVAFCFLAAAVCALFGFGFCVVLM
ncbi:MAG: DUF1700 domain-containing protein, partial [Eggerthellaceae bacterium]|nr:DUF1700 domain-containing protein [Eggerthellaceae bacterium]